MQLKETCDICHSASVHVRCGATLQWLFGEEEWQLQMMTKHTAHPRPPQVGVAPTVKTAICIQSGGQGPKTMMVRTGLAKQFPSMLVPERVERWIRHDHIAMYPDGTGFEGLATLNAKLFMERFVLNPITHTNFACQTLFQQQLISQTIKDGDLPWAAPDITFNQSNDFHKFVIAMWVPRLCLTIKVFECWIKGSSYFVYAFCWESFFIRNEVFHHLTGDFLLGGIISDFELPLTGKGLRLAVGRVLVRREGCLLQPSIGESDEYDKMCLKKAMDVQFTSKYVKGCLFHYEQSVKRLKECPPVVEAKFSAPFFAYCQKMLGTESKKEYNVCVANLLAKDIKQVTNWTQWWTRQETASKIFKSQMHAAGHHNDPGAPTVNNAEVINRDEQRCIRHTYQPIAMAVSDSFNYIRFTQVWFEGILTGQAAPRKPRGKGIGNVPPDLRKDLRQQKKKQRTPGLQQLANF